MNVKDNIYKYLEYKGIAVATVEHDLGWSDGGLRKAKSITSDRLKQFILYFEDVSPEWLLTGEGSMLRSEYQRLQSENVIPISNTKTPEKIYPQSEFELYDIDVSAGFSRLFTEDCRQESLGTISLPNMPRCDGAVKVSGDSMFPLLKSGDIIAFRKLNSLDSILYGEMYIVQIECDSDISVVVKYVKRSEMGEDYLNLVSYNKEYDPKDVRKENITALARVILCIRQFSI